MTEQEYIKATALGTISAAINTLRSIVPENLEGIILEGESKRVFGTLYDWQERLFEEVKKSPYEYEMLIDDEEGTPFQTNSWIPITTDRIKDISKINEYIEKGLMRKL